MGQDPKGAELTFGNHQGFARANALVGSDTPF
jgi:hypothetical protein